MDRLPVTEQEKLRKSSDDRLRQKLINAGESETDVKSMSRAALLAACAEHRAKTLAEAAAVLVKPAYDPELEKARLAFEQQRWQQELEEREKQRELEKARITAEAKQKEEELRLKEVELKLEREKLEKNEELQRQLKAEELKMKQKELDRHETAVSKMKLFGDALRNSVTRMSNDPVEIVSFFRSVEQLYKSLNVPTELQAALVRPHLNERSRNLVTKLSPEVAVDYVKLRDAILAEYKLSPNTYLDRFNTLARSTDETTVMFASKLETLLNYYLEARQVKDFATLRELIICDRIKSTLSEPCLRYILSVESTKDKGWLDIRGLTADVDKYLSSHVGDKPRAYAIGNSVSQKPSNASGVSGSFGKTPPHKPPPPKSNHPPFGQGQAGSSVTSGNGTRRCFTCNSPDHLRSQCPHSTNKIQGPRSDDNSRNVKKVNACQVDSNMKRSHAFRNKRPDTSHCKTESDGFGNNSSDLTGSVVKDASSMTTDISAQECALEEAAALFRGSTSGFAAVNEVVAMTEMTEQQHDLTGSDVRVDTVGVALSDVNKHKSVSHILSSDYMSQLSYFPVKISDAPSGGKFCVVNALADSGSEIAVVSRKRVSDFDCAPLAKVQLRAFIGSAVEADVVKLFVRHASDVLDDKRCIAVCCTVCDDMREDLILTTSVMNKLCAPCMSDFTVDSPLKDEDNEEDVDNLSSGDHSDSGMRVENGNDETDFPVIQSSSGVRVNTVRDDDLVQTDSTSKLVEHKTGDDGNDQTEPPDKYDTDGLVDHADSSTGSATAEELRLEQESDDTLKGSWRLASKQRGNFFVKNGMLFHKEMILGQEFEQICLPSGRRKQVMGLAHDIAGGHLGAKRTRERIRLSFWWPTMTRDVKSYVQKCEACQKRARVTSFDRVPITAIPRNDHVFSHWFIDCMGPLFNHKVEYNYALIMVDSASRWPACFPLRSLTAKAVCEAILQLWQFTGCGNIVSSDCGTNFTSQLTREFMSRLGCSPRFATPGHPQACGLAERMVATVKGMVSKMAADHPKSWHRYIGYALWALREIPNETTGVPPWVMVFGHLPRGPLSILKESWCGERSFPLSLGKSSTDFLKDLRQKLDIAHSYAQSHSDREQHRYVTHYNLRSADKHFSVGDKVLILHKDSTASRVFSRWKGPGTIVEVVSPYSYLVEIDGARRVYHANHLRKFHLQVNAVTCGPLIVNATSCSSSFVVDTCAVVREEDHDFGQIQFSKPLDKQSNTDLPPSQRLDLSSLSHLSEQQRVELLTLLDRYADCFSETPGFTDKAEHFVPISGDFKPKRMRAYRVPERLKPQVKQQIQEMLQQGIITPSSSPMASPLVCVLKGKNGCDGVRLAVDYRYVNKFTEGDAFPIQDISSLIQRVGKAKYITTCDAKSGYYQTPVHPSHRWLTAFVCDEGLFEFTRTPFGMKSSGATFVRAIQEILKPIKDFTDAYVDDMAIFSNQWYLHLNDLEEYLKVIRSSGITLNLKKCRFAQKEVKFCGEIIGNGKRRANPEKLSIIQDMQKPQTKTELRRMLGFFSFFREHIPDFARIAKPLTDLTTKKVSNRIPWNTIHDDALESLKRELCLATERGLHIVDFDKPFDLFVDASGQSVGGVLTQSDDKGINNPVAFCSIKLNDTQRRWSTIEREAFAALSCLQKYRSWLFGTKVTLHSDHNPLQYLTETAPKSSKLMRWALSIQEYDVVFKYRCGRTNIAADFLSRVDWGSPGEKDT